MKLKNSQIEFIEQDLLSRGVSFNPLHEDLVDHICCEVEERISKGETFMDAYERVINRFERRGLNELNKETISILTFTTMIRSFFLTAFRILKKNWTYSAIRILGLAVGISAFLLSFLYLVNESSYDTFHGNSESIYRIGRITESGKIATTTFPLVPTLREEFPQYEFTQFFKDRSNALFRKNDQMHFESKMIFADEFFTQLFAFDNFKGDPKTALRDPYTVVMTEAVSEKYFGRVARLGEVLEFKWNGEYYPLKITGLIPSLPPNMHINFEVFVSFETGRAIFPGGITNAWDMNYCYSYVKLPSGVSPDQFQGYFQKFFDNHINDEDKDYKEYLGFLQPLTMIHLQPEVKAGYTNVIDPTFPRLALGIGLLILLITAINFITLTIAQFNDRAKEVGIRKVVGATRTQVVFQFIFETLILVGVSFLLGLGSLYVLVDVFNQFMHTEISVSVVSLGWLFWGLPTSIILLTIVTGLYPAIFFSAKNIMDTIHLKKGRSAMPFRRILLMTQYVIAATLISFCLIIYMQINYVKNQPVGYDKSQVLYIPHGRSIRDNPEVFKTLAMQNASIENVSLSFYKPTDIIGNAIDVKVEGGDYVKIAATSIDEDFFDTYKIDFVDGIGFQREGMNMEKAFILNEAAVKYLQLDNPIGQTIETDFQTGSPALPVEHRIGQIIGVVKDVHFESLHNGIKPVIFMVKPYWYFYINVRVNQANIQSSLTHLESTWKGLFPDLPFEYSFLDEDFNKMYQKEQRLADGLAAMGILALLTTCLGLFGYVRFMAQQKTKEVGIRKVLGATMFQISTLFSKEFGMTMVLANIISLPIAYYTSILWLQNFSYRVDITALPFMVTLFSIVGISILTVLNELIKVMEIDPSKTLRYD